jgi:hypothetical protein
MVQNSGLPPGLDPDLPYEQCVAAMAAAAQDADRGAANRGNALALAPPDDDDDFDDHESGADDDYEPVALRHRHDGWTPERQTAFLEALAATACVREAAAAVGLSARGAYALRARPEAQAFRLAWDAALDLGVRQLADAALSRAIHGVGRPIFYQGEQVGERRYYDERLTQFLLRLRDPKRFGRWREGREPVQHIDGPALAFGRLFDLAQMAAWDGEEQGTPALPDPDMLHAALVAMGLAAPGKRKRRRRAG